MGMALTPLAFAAPAWAAATWKKTPDMDAVTCLRTRRSVRKFTGEAIAPDLIREMIAAGTSAPSAGNQQPWQFVVIDDAEKKTAISKAYNGVAFAGSASACILVCFDPSKDKFKDGPGGGYWVQDLAACSQNILLAAHALGFGGVWTGVFPREDRAKALREIAKLPPEIIPFSLLVIGRPAERPEPADRFEESRIHKNNW